ncbi:MAG: penicillin acylase family protein, partial [Candidatus Kariarchaeaceae archaeon]
MLKRVLIYTASFIVILLLIVSMGLIAGVRNGSNHTHIAFNLDGIDGDIEIYRDEFGVPTVVGDSLKDLLFGQGYAFAQDRTFQLEFYRSLI